MADPNLLDLQRWLSIVIQHPKDATTAVRSKGAGALIPSAAAMRGEVVIPSKTMQPMARLDVYNGGYLNRLVDAMRSDFPGLIHALGDDGFFGLVQDYVQRHPSRHANLIFLADHLPEFVAGRRKLAHSAFLRDLAQLEALMGESFHAEECKDLDTSALHELAPEAWQDLTLTASPSLRLLQTNYPVDGYLQAVFDGSGAKIPGREVSHLAIYRKKDRVWRRRLSKPGYRILSSLKAGETFGAALRHAGNATVPIGDWFQDWSADGLFVGYTSNQTAQSTLD